MTDLGPFHNRPEERALYDPLPAPGRMLELGNKRNGDRTYKAFFQRRGWEHVSVDWNGQDGALRRDLRAPLGLGSFDVVTNIGTSEHVSDQRGVWSNIIDAMHVGSLLISTTPMPPDDWKWHGEWHVDDLWLRELCARNGLDIERLYISGSPPRRMLFLRAVRREVVPFCMPALPIHHNHPLGARPSA